MFVVSVSKNKIKKSIITAAVVMFVSLCVVLVFKGIYKMQNSGAENGVKVNVTGEEDLLEFISQLGWETDEQPLEVREVVIPEEFDEVYNNYNQIQLSQGYDLEKYAGYRVKRWTFVVRNYPEVSPEDDFVRINILVFNNEIIGGDVCSVKLDGFMHGFYKE